MCLAVPLKLIEINGKNAIGEAMGMTRQPSITASSALMGSISVTITLAPRPLARKAMPRPHQP